MIVVTTGQATRFGAIASTLRGRRPARSSAASTARHLHAPHGFLVLFVLLSAVRAPAVARDLPVRRSAGGRPDPRTPADGDDGHAVAGRDADGAKQAYPSACRPSTTSAPWTCCVPTRPVPSPRHDRLVGHLDRTARDSARVLELARLNSRFEPASAARSTKPSRARRRRRRSRWRKIDEIPFDFERAARLGASARRRAHAYHQGRTGACAASCATLERATAAAVPLDDPPAMRIVPRCQRMGGEGLRVLGVACARAC